MTGVADADDAAVRQQDPARALHLQHEDIDRIIEPQHLEAATLERAVVDIPARVIGHEPAGFDAADDSMAFQLRIEVAEIDLHMVFGHAVDRHRIAAALLAGRRAARFRNSR